MTPTCSPGQPDPTRVHIISEFGPVTALALPCQFANTKGQIRNLGEGKRRRQREQIRFYFSAMWRVGKEKKLEAWCSEVGKWRA